MESTREFIRVMTASDLRKLRGKKDAHYKLYADIDMGGALWNPIGTAKTPFTGILEGNGYRIRNLVLQYPSSDGNLGLFSRNEGQLRDLTLEDVTILPAEAVEIGGIFAATNAGTIQNCRVAGSNVPQARTFGFIAGCNCGTIRDCTVAFALDTPLPAQLCFGGVTGVQQAGVLEGCRVNGSWKPADNQLPAGLLAGRAEGGDIRTCLAGGQPDGKLVGNGGAVTDCLLQDLTHTDDLLTPAQKQIRQCCVDHMRKQGTCPWSPDVTLRWESVYGHASVTQTFHAGRQYYGLPYTNKYGSYERFCYCFEENGNLKPFLREMPNGYDGFDLYMGNDCTGSVYWAWARIGCSFRFKFSGDAFPWSDGGLLAVGKYRYEEGMQTDEICRENGEQSMAEAYAAMHLGDGILQRQKVGGGHMRMCAVTPVVFRDERGRIDLSESYLLCHENGGNLGGCAGLKGWNSSWLIDHRYTFRELFDTHYIPVTIKELAEGRSPDAEFTQDIKGVNLGTVSSNYRIISTTASICDSRGDCLWKDVRFTAVHKFDTREHDAPARSTVRSVDLQAHGTVELPKTGERCSYRVEVLLSNGRIFRTDPYFFTI